MVATESAVPQAELDALADDKPLIIADNVLRDATAARWNTLGTINGTDLSGADSLPYKAWDGHLHTTTKISTTQQADYYLNVTIPADRIVDVLFLKHTSVPASCTLNVQASADVNWSSPITVHTQTLNSTNRIVALSLTGAGGSDRRFSDFQSWRLHYTSGAPFAFPWLGQWIIAQRRQLSGKAWYPYDKDVRGIEYVETKARGRARKRHTYAKGFQDIRGEWVIHDGDYGLDDVTTIRQLYKESEYGGESIVYVEDPSSNPSGALFVEDQNEELRLDLEDVTQRIWEVNYAELPPFAAVES